MLVFSALLAGWLGLPASLSGGALPVAPAQRAACVGPPQDLVAWWPLDETAGMVSGDLVAANDGFFVGSPKPVQGAVAGALSFDGANDYVQVPSAAVLNVSTRDFTIDAWVSPSQVQGVRSIVDKREFAGSLVTGYELFLYAGNVGLQVADGGYDNYISKIAHVAADGAFHHIAVTVTRQPLTITFYLDGIAQDTLTANAHSGSLDNTAPLLLGATAQGPSPSWAGVLDEVEIFSRRLSGPEVRGIANAGAGGKCKCAPLPAHPVAWWPFDESTGTVAADTAGHFSGPHDATLSGASHTSGKVGRALVFDGVSSAATVADDAMLDPNLVNGAGYTIDGWIRTSQLDAPLAGKLAAQAEVPMAWELSLSGGALSFSVLGAGGTCSAAACAHLADDSWHLVGATVTHDPGGLNVVVRLYVDGQMAQVFPPRYIEVAPQPFPGTFLVGFVPAPTSLAQGEYYAGKLDELEIFDRALTAADFTRIYRAAGAGKCTPAVPAQVCGVAGAEPCAAGQFCDYLLAAGCGVDPTGGLCREIPESCSLIFSPVCGCDGKTYANACTANAAGVAVTSACACSSAR